MEVCTGFEMCMRLWALGGGWCAWSGLKFLCWCCWDYLILVCGWSLKLKFELEKMGLVMLDL